MITLVMVDDHDVVRHGIRSLFDGVSGFCVSGEAATLADAEELVGVTHADVVLLDVRLPDSDDGRGAVIREAVLAVHYGDRVIPAEAMTEPGADQDPLAKERSPLSPREREVLQLLAEGYQNKEIAGLLNLAEKSVRNIVTRLFRKLRVSNRTEAALKARDILPLL